MYRLNIARATFLLTTLGGLSNYAVAQFENRAVSLVPASTDAVAVGDFNRDGKLDVAAIDYYVTILLGNGDGTFHSGAQYTVPFGEDSILAADLRNDGILDLVVTSRLGQDVYVLLGNGDGTFQQPVSYPTLGYPFSNVSLADVTGDGKLDVIVCTDVIGTANYINVLPGNGDGTFGSPITSLIPDIGGTGIALGYFNGDQKLDLATTGSFGNQHSVVIFLGNGDGTFVLNGEYEVGLSPDGVVTADFNADGNADLAIADGVSGTVSVLLGNGDGTFQPDTPYVTGFLGAIIATDLNGDGKVDIAASTVGVTVLTGNGDGTFQPAMTYPWPKGGGTFVAAADFNGDGQPDLVTAAIVNQVITFLNTGVAHFSPTTMLQFPDQLVGSTSKPQTVTLTNGGAAPLTISSMKLSSSQFGMASTCGASVASGAQCAITLNFSPTSIGNKLGHVSLIDNASTKPQIIELMGQGTVMEFKPRSLNFGTQKLNTKSAPQSVTLTNRGTAPVNVTKIYFKGEGQYDFLQTNDCPASLNAGASCTVMVTFDPYRKGPRPANLAAADNGGASPQTIPLSGSGS